VTAENQEQADMRIPVLLQTPASVRFVSVEPMLGPVNLTRINLGVQKTRGYGSRQIIWDALSGWEKQYETNRSLRSMFQQTPKCMSNDIGGRLNWVICGGETGPGARPMHPNWVRSLVLQCKNAGVPIFVKQIGSVWAKANSNYRVSNRPEEWPEDLRIRELPPSHNCSLTP
jgi:protein gp37